MPKILHNLQEFFVCPFVRIFPKKKNYLIFHLMLISQYLLFRNGLNDRQKVLLLLMISFSYTSLNNKFFCVIFITILVHLQVCVSISVEHHLELQHFYIFKLFLQKTFTYGHKIIQSKLAEKSRSLEFFLSV